MSGSCASSHSPTWQESDQQDQEAQDQKLIQNPGQADGAIEVDESPDVPEDSGDLLKTSENGPGSVD